MKQRLCCSRTESFNSFFYNFLLVFVGRGGTLVDSMPLDRKVVGSNPILAATPGTLTKSFTHRCKQRFFTFFIIFIKNAFFNVFYFLNAFYFLVETSFILLNPQK